MTIIITAHLDYIFGNKHYICYIYPCFPLRSRNKNSCISTVQMLTKGRQHVIRENMHSCGDILYNFPMHISNISQQLMSWPDWLGQQHWQGEEFCKDTFNFFKVISTGLTAGREMKFEGTESYYEFSVSILYYHKLLSLTKDHNQMLQRTGQQIFR